MNIILAASDMTAAEIIQIIAAIGTLATVILSGLATVFAALARRNSLENTKSIQIVKDSTDGMKDALVEATRSKALQEGHAEGVKEQKESMPTEPMEVKVVNPVSDPVPIIPAKPTK